VGWAKGRVNVAAHASPLGPTRCCGAGLYGAQGGQAAAPEAAPLAGAELSHVDAVNLCSALTNTLQAGAARPPAASPPARPPPALPAAKLHDSAGMPPCVPCPVVLGSTAAQLHA